MSLFTDEALGAEAGTPKPDLGLLEGTAKSALWSPLSLIGVEAPPDLEAWRGEHPFASILSQLAGYSVPYSGWFKAAKAIPPLERAVQIAGAAVKDAPFKAAAAREIVRYAPFELGRIAGASVFGEDLSRGLGTQFSGVGDVALQSGVDLALIGGTSGIFEALAAAGKRARPEDALPGVDLKQPPQMQIRQLQQNMDQGLVADKDFALSRLESLKRGVRLQERPASGRYIHGLEGEGDARAVNRLFREKTTTGLVRSRLVRTATGAFQNQTALDDVLARAGLGKDYEAYVQTPRYVQAKSPEAQNIVSSVLTRNLKPLDSEKGWFYNRDPKDGLWVMGKKVSDREWLLFKTDSPGRFVPDREAYAKSAITRAAVFGKEPIVKTPLGDGAEVFDAGLKYYNDVPLIDTRGLDPRKGSTAEFVNKLTEKAGLGKLTDATGSIAEGASKFAHAYLAPGMFQFNHPIAAKAFNMAKAALDTAEGTAERLFLGSKGLSGTRQTLFHEIWRGAKPLATDDNIQALIKAAHTEPGQWEAFWRTVNAGASAEEGIKGFNLGGSGLKLWKALDAVDSWVQQGLAKTAEATGARLAKPKQFHVMASHSWKGDWRIPVYDGGKVIGYASGFKRGSALAEAQAIQEAARAEGVALRLGKPALAGELEQDLRHLRLINAENAKLFGQLKDKAYLQQRAPTRLLEERKGLKYYTGSLQPWTRDEFERLILKQLRDYQRYQARLTTEHLLKDDLTTLMSANPDIYDQLIHRINSMYGIQGQFSTSVNKAVDKVLSPYLGRNSADKIVGAANKGLFRWTLGFVNTGYNVANALTFIQTSFPQLAFLTTAAPSRIAQYYTYWPVKGQKAFGSIGVLDMMKLTGRSFKLMRSPDDVLWQHFGRAAREGVWDPRFVEEFLGQKATALQGIRGVLKGEEPFSKFLAAGADFLPSLTEKFARGHSFTLGHTFFREIMGVKDPEVLYQLTKQFVEKTQFLYSTGDRARIITGPLGSAAGLFKNWVMHQIAWMAEYTGEGVLRGNWRPLMWMMGSTTAIGGVGALPFFSVADGMSKWLSQKGIMEHTYEGFGGTERDGMGSVSDAVFYGFPAFLNFSIQNQVSAPFSDPGKDAARLFSIAYLDRLKYMQKAAGQAIDHWSVTGESPVKDPRTRDLFMRAFAPKTLYQVTQTIQDETLKSLATGHPITTLSPAERYMYGFGLTPRWVESSYRVADELWQSQDKMKQAVSAYGLAWAELQEAGDSVGLERLVTKAVYEGVDVSSVIKSANARLSKGREDMIERQFKPSEILKYRSLGLVSSP